MFSPGNDRVLNIPDKYLWHFGRTSNIIHHSGSDGAFGHSIEFCSGVILGEHHSACLLYCPDTKGSVTPRAAQDDGYGIFSSFLGKRTEEDVDRQVKPCFTRWIYKVEPPTKNGHILLGRNKVDIILGYQHTIAGRLDRDGGMPRQKFPHQALVIRGQVLDHYVCYSAALRNISEKSLQGFQSSGRSSDPHYGKKHCRCICHLGLADLLFCFFHPGKKMTDFGCLFLSEPNIISHLHISIIF